VTLKMRLGWDEKTINAPELARRAEAAGIRMVTVHGRTRCQFYNGAADWAAIRAIKETVAIPVVANGDLAHPQDLGRMLALSGADAVMIGRGAYGRPWLPGHLATFAATGEMPAAPTGEALADLVSRHYAMMIDHYGERDGVRCARKHLGWYLEGAGVGRPLRGALMSEERAASVMRLVREALPGGAERVAA